MVSIGAEPPDHHGKIPERLVLEYRDQRNPAAAFPRAMADWVVTQNSMVPLQ